MKYADVEQFFINKVGISGGRIKKIYGHQMFLEDIKLKSLVRIAIVKILKNITSKVKSIFLLIQSRKFIIKNVIIKHVWVFDRLRKKLSMNKNYMLKKKIISLTNVDVEKKWNSKGVNFERKTSLKTVFKKKWYLWPCDSLWMVLWSVCMIHILNIIVLKLLLLQQDRFWKLWRH